MTEPRSPLEQALDVVLYAPVGLALTARDELPGLIEKGRQRVSSQVALFKMVGQFAVTQGQQEAGKLVRSATEGLTGLSGRGGAPEPVRPAVAPPAEAAVAGSPGAGTPGAGGSALSAEPRAQAAASARRAPAGPPSTTSPGAPRAPLTAGAPPQPVPAGLAGANGSSPAPAGDGLAIPGYDALSASQVVQRLAGLSSGELEAVRAYETATRGRRTILSRIAQLQTGAS